MKRLMIAVIALIGLSAAHHGNDRDRATKGARVFFENIQNGDTVGTTVTIKFGIEGMTIAPAGTDEENTGHHHLLIDTNLPAMAQPIPMDEHHMHFGGGQTEVTLELSPGEHTLQLLLGDWSHIPHVPPVKSDKIRITVVEE